MKSIVMVALLALTAIGCDRADATSRSKDGASRAVDPVGAPTQAPPDNTKKNERDHDPGAVTPGDQGESDADLAITQHIRQGIMKIDGMSTNGKNVKIITVGGRVTLRGPVDTDREKMTIILIAQREGGVKLVDDRLEVKKPSNQSGEK